MKFQTFSCCTTLSGYSLIGGFRFGSVSLPFRMHLPDTSLANYTQVWNKVLLFSVLDGRFYSLWLVYDMFWYGLDTSNMQIREGLLSHTSPKPNGLFSFSCARLMAHSVWYLVFRLCPTVEGRLVRPFGSLQVRSSHRRTPFLPDIVFQL